MSHDKKVKSEVADAIFGHILSMGGTMRFDGERFTVETQNVDNLNLNVKIKGENGMPRYFTVKVSEAL